MHEIKKNVIFLKVIQFNGRAVINLFNFCLTLLSSSHPWLNMVAYNVYTTVTTVIIWYTATVLPEKVYIFLLCYHRNTVYDI